MEKNIIEWYNTMWLTRAARFNSFRRVKSMHDISSVAIFMNSFYIITINLLLLTGKFTSESASQNIATLNVILSVLILAISLYVKGKNYQKQYTDYHNSAKRLSPLYSKLKTVKNNKEWETNIDNIISEYNKIIELEDLNHTEFDYLKVLIAEDKSKYDRSTKIKNFYKYSIEPYATYVIMIIAPLILIYCLLK